MSALDFTARALALRALARDPLTFAEAQQARLPNNVIRFDSSGHTQRGLGAATYVADDLATAALRDLHPDAVIAASGGGNLRLVGDSHGYITPEQLGCPTYVPGTNQLSWLQAAIAYVEATPGLNGVLLTQPQYEVWRDPAVPSGANYGSTANSSAGHFLIVRKPMRIVGTHAFGTRINFKGPTGGNLLTDYSVVDGTAYGDDKLHRGYGFLLWGTVVDSGAVQPEDSLPSLYLENLTLSTGMVGERDATWPASLSNPNCWDITNKAIAYRNDRQAGKIELRNVIIDGFLGEAVYFGGTFGNNKTASKLVARNLKVLNTNAQAINPNGPAEVDVDGLYAENCRASFEGWAGWVHGRIINATFKNVLTGGIAGSNTYAAPRRTDNTQPFLYFDNVVIQGAEDVAQGAFFYAGSYLKGRMHLIDTRLMLVEAASTVPMKDIDLDVTIECDKLSLDGAIQLKAATGAPAQSVENVQVRALLTRSTYARANTKYVGCAVAVGGSLGPNCTIRLRGDHAGYMPLLARADTALTAFRPKIIFEGLDGAGTWASYPVYSGGAGFNASTTPTPEFGLGWLQATFGGSGVTARYPVTPPATTWFNDGHEVVIDHADSSCPLATLLVDGRVVLGYGDRCKLRANKLHARWDVIEGENVVLGPLVKAGVLAAGAGQARFIMPQRAFKCREVMAQLGTAQAANGGGGILTFDVNEGGNSILSATKLTVDNTEKTSRTAATYAHVADVDLAAGAVIDLDIDQIGNGTAADVAIYLIGKWA